MEVVSEGKREHLTKTLSNVSEGETGESCHVGSISATSIPDGGGGVRGVCVGHHGGLGLFVGMWRMDNAACAGRGRSNTAAGSTMLVTIVPFLLWRASIIFPSLPPPALLNCPPIQKERCPQSCSDSLESHLQTVIPQPVSSVFKVDIVLKEGQALLWLLLKWLNGMNGTSVARKVLILNVLPGVSQRHRSLKGLASDEENQWRNDMLLLVYRSTWCANENKTAWNDSHKCRSSQLWNMAATKTGRAISYWTTERGHRCTLKLFEDSLDFHITLG